MMSKKTIITSVAAALMAIGMATAPAMARGGGGHGGGGGGHMGGGGGFHGGGFHGGGFHGGGFHGGGFHGGGFHGGHFAGGFGRHGFGRGRFFVGGFGGWGPYWDDYAWDYPYGYYDEGCYYHLVPYRGHYVRRYYCS